MALIFFVAPFASGVEAADHAELARDPQWAALLHVSHGRPQIRDPDFYILKKFDTEAAELSRTLEVLRGPAAQDFACRFPARAFWLQRHLQDLPFDLTRCPELREFSLRAPLETAAVVFAAEDISQPSSMMGHVLIKIQGKNESGQTVAHAISFFTEVHDINFIKLIVESLVTGKKGFYTLGPYDDVKAHYLFAEQRNVWEYELRLDTPLRKLLQLELFELKSTKFTYYFDSFNCATLVRDILGVLHPELLEPKRFWVTPLSVVRSVDHPDYVERRLVSPVSTWRIGALEDTLTPSRASLREIKQRSFNQLQISGASKQDQVLLLELARASNDHEYESSRISIEDWRDADRHLRGQEIPNDSVSHLDFSDYKTPSKIPKDSQVFIGERRSPNARTEVIGVLPAGRRLVDDSSQYQSESELKLGEFALGYEVDANRLTVDSFTLFSAQSLRARRPLAGGVSWLLNFGYAHDFNEFLDGEQGRFAAQTAVGWTFRLARDVDLYTLGEIKLRSGAEAAVTVGPDLGFVVREIYDLKTIAAFSHSTGYFGTSVFEANVSESIALANVSLSLNYRFLRRTVTSAHLLVEPGYGSARQQQSVESAEARMSFFF